MHKLSDLRRSGLTLTEVFFTLLRLQIKDPLINVWHDLYRAGYGTRDYFDFTHKSWVSLPVDRQIKYASEYQNWYAERLGQGVERSFEGIVFRLIPPGKYVMGSPKDEEGHFDDEKQRKVFIKSPFWCGKYAVTQKEWFIVMQDNPSRFTGWWDRPVERVSWNDCQEFCDHTYFRLLHEKQWEYACRGGTTTAYSFGDDSKLLDNYAYYADNSEGHTHPVGDKLPNSFGLYDMHGNVWEWSDNLYNNASANRVFRGGSWGGSAGRCRSADRVEYVPSDRWGDLGLRVCRPITL